MKERGKAAVVAGGVGEGKGWWRLVVKERERSGSGSWVRGEEGVATRSGGERRRKRTRMRRRRR